MELDVSENRELFTLFKDGKYFGDVRVENGMIATYGQIGEDTYYTFLDLLIGLQGFGFGLDDIPLSELPFIDFHFIKAPVYRLSRKV